MSQDKNNSKSNDDAKQALSQDDLSKVSGGMGGAFGKIKKAAKKQKKQLEKMGMFDDPQEAFDQVEDVMDQVQDNMKDTADAVTDSLGSFFGNNLEKDFIGTDGNDDLEGNRKDNTIVGGEGNDTLDGQSGDDTITGGQGRDNIDGGTGNDRIDGGSGRDNIDGGSGSDILIGGAGNDHIDGGNDADVLIGGEGNDRLDGEKGDDIIIGGEGNDTATGGYGDDTYIYTRGEGNDTFNGGKGQDTITLKGLTSIEGWTIEAPNGKTYELGDYIKSHPTSVIGMMNQAIDGVQNSFKDGLGGLFGKMGMDVDDFEDNIPELEDGIITSPDGNTLDFSNIENIEVDFIEPESGTSYPIQTPIEYPDNLVSTVVSGLPAGVYVSGAANPPVLADDGTYFQVVDSDALSQGEVSLEFNEGFFGDVDYSITTYSGDPDNLKEDSREFSLEVEPTNNALLFAQSGSMTLTADSRDDRRPDMNNTPLDLIVNPLLGDDATITISGLQLDATLLDRNGDPVTNTLLNNQFNSNQDFAGKIGGAIQAGFGAVGDALGRLSPQVSMTVEQYKDLGPFSMDLSDSKEDVNISVAISGEFEGQDVEAFQEVHFEVPDFERASNGDMTLNFEGDRRDYQVERVGNSLILSNNSNPSDVTRVSMVDFDHIKFDNAVVSSQDFVKSLDVQSAVDQIMSTSDDPENTLVVVNGLPEGAVVNNAVALGGGAFGIPVGDIQDGNIDIDLPSLNTGVSAGVSVNAYAMTEGQAEFFNGQGRISGYANAEAYAEAGTEANFSIGPDGVSAEARAYIGAGAVATAGGSVSVDGVGTVYGEVSAEVYVGAEASAGVDASDTGVSMNAYVGAEATASLTATVGWESDVIPGTGAEATGSVGVTTYAYVGGEGEVNFGDGAYGVSGEAGAEAGMMVTADGYASGSVAGFGGGAGAGVSAGLGAGASAGGYAGYEDGVIGFGVSGELALLIGVEFDLDISIDLNAVADTAELIGEGIIDAGEAIGDGFIEVGDAIEEGFIEVGEALEQGFVEVGDLIETGVMDAYQAVEAGLIEVGEAIEEGFAEVGDFAEDAWEETGEFFEDAGDEFVGGMEDVGEGIGDGIEYVVTGGGSK